MFGGAAAVSAERWLIQQGGWVEKPEGQIGALKYELVPHPFAFLSLPATGSGPDFLSVASCFRRIDGHCGGKLALMNGSVMQKAFVPSPAGAPAG